MESSNNLTAKTSSVRAGSQSKSSFTFKCKADGNMCDYVVSNGMVTVITDNNRKIKMTYESIADAKKTSPIVDYKSI